VQFRLEPVEDGTRVIVETNVNLSGSVAQYGRGTGVIQGVASQLTAQFAQNLKAMLARGDDQEDEPEPIVAVASAPAAQDPNVPEPTAEPLSVASPGAQTVSPEPAPVSAASATGAAAAMIAAAARTEVAAARAEAAAARVEAVVARVEASVARAEATATALKKAVRPPAPPLPPSKPISGLSLMFTVLWGMITGVFSSKKNG
jgi:hypothetical protein